MQQGFSVVIADTTCFILLSKIDKLQLLQQLFVTITTTEIIAKEYGKQLPDRVIVAPINDTHYLDILNLELDEGEASAISLSFEFEKSLLVLDDLKARKLATRLNLNFTGTLGLLLKAKENGLIPSIKPILQEIQSNNFRFSENVCNEILAIAGE